MPPVHAVWLSEPQFTDLLLASRPYIEAEALANQLELGGLNLIQGCANLLGGFARSDAEGQNEAMMEAVRGLVDVTIKRIAALGEPSTEMLTTEVEMLNTLGQLYHDYHYSPILNSILHIMEHFQSNVSHTTSQQGSDVVAALGRVIEGAESDADDYPTPIVKEAIILIDDLVDKASIDWDDESTHSLWASNSTMLAMVQYMKHLLDQGDVKASRKEFAAAYAATVDKPRWETLSDGRTRLELRKVSKRLQELVDPEKAFLASEEAEIVPQNMLA